MAEQIGSVSLDLILDQSGFKAGLDAAVRESRRKADQIAQALNSRQSRVSQLDKEILRLGKEKLAADASRSSLIQQQIGYLRVEQQQQQRGISVLREKLAVQQQLSREQQAAARAAVGGAGVQGLAGDLASIPGIGGAAGLFAGGPAGAAIAGASAIAAAIGTIATFSIKAADEMQRLNQQLLLLTKSQPVTDAIIANLRDYALATPFDTPELADTTKLLLAYGLSAKDAVDATKRLGDVATVTGTDINGLALNFGQIISQGRTYSVDLRQFALRGVPIFETLAQVTGKSVAELKNLEGGIPADQVVEAFRRMTSEGGKFFEGGAKGGTALNRELATIQDNSKRVGDVIGKVLTPALTAGVSSVAGLLGDTAKALEDIKANADKALENPLVARLYGFGGKVAAKLITPAPLAIAGDLAGIAGGAAGKSPGVPTIPQELIDRAEELLTLAAARAKAEREIVKPAQEQLSALQKTIGLEGSALQIAQTQLAVEKAKAAEIAARQKLLKAIDSPESVADQQALVAAAKAAGITLKIAQLEAGQALKDAAKESASILKALPKELQSQIQAAATDGLSEAAAAAGEQYAKLIDQANKPTILSEANLLKMAKAYDAYDQRLADNQKALENAGLGLGKFSAAALTAVQNFSNAVKAADSARFGVRTAEEGAYKFLTNDRQQKLLDLALKDIQTKGPGLGVDLRKVDITNPQSLFEALGAVRSLDDANKALQAALENQTIATEQLAAKDWQVSVNVDAGGGTSEVNLS